jgi:phosphate transport system substrate-binding protein
MRSDAPLERMVVLMRRTLCVLGVLLLCLGAASIASGCDSARPAATTPVAPVTRLRVSGSGTALPLLRILASAQPNKSVQLVFLPGLHSGGGITGVNEGSLDLGAVSRPLTDKEKTGLELTWLSDDGLILAVNPSVGQLGVKGLTTQQVRDIYSGKITDWSQVGAKSKMPIVVLDRHEDESAKIILRQYVLGKGKTTPKSLPLYYESDMVDAVQSTPGAIGYFSLGYAISQNVKAERLKLDGIEPTLANVMNGTYKVVRPLGVVVRRSAPATVTHFVEWATSDEARKIMTDKGYAPYPR